MADFRSSTIIVDTKTKEVKSEGFLRKKNFFTYFPAAESQPSNHRRQEYFQMDCQHHQQPQEPYSCRSCEMDVCASQSNLHHLSPLYMNKQLGLLQQQNNFLIKSPLTKRTSLSQESLRCQQAEQYQYSENPVIKNSRNLLRLNKMRLFKSEESLNEICRAELKQLAADQDTVQRDYSSSDDDYLTDTQRNFDTSSSQSLYSITTEANCDFEFFQNKTGNNSNNPLFNNSKTTMDFKQLNELKRSSSKRSLDNWSVLFEEESGRRPRANKIQRSSSFMNFSEQRRKNPKLLRSDSKLSDCTHNIMHKIKSVEYLPSSNASTVFIEDVLYFNYPNQRENGEIRNYVGSVPDLKKVFISEYI